MIELFLILLRLLFPRDPVAAMTEAMRFFLGSLLARLEDAETLLQLQNDPRERASLEAAIASAEDGINLIIHHRARQILGLRLTHIPANTEHPPHCARPLHEVLARFERAVSLYENIERLAQRRAQRMKREMADNPLDLDVSTPSCPRYRYTCVPQDGMPRRSVAKAGGGCALARGPPLLASFSENPLPQRESF